MFFVLACYLQYSNTVVSEDSPCRHQKNCILQCVTHNNLISFISKYTYPLEVGDDGVDVDVDAISTSCDASCI